MNLYRTDDLNDDEFQESDTNEIINSYKKYQYSNQNSFIYPINHKIPSSSDFEKDSDDNFFIEDSFDRNKFLNKSYFGFESNNHHQYEEFQRLLSKYNQLKEEFRVQKQLIAKRESREQSLHDQLNQVTVQLAQLRLIRDDLTSALKLTEAKNQYLTKELTKINQSISRNEEKNQMELIKLKSLIETKQNDINNMKKNYEFMHENLKSENKELKNSLNSARKQLDSIQNENYRLINESQSIFSQYESEKAGKNFVQKNLNELQIRFEKVSKDFSDFREQNEKLNFSLIQLQNNLQDLTAENRRCLLDRNFIENQAKSLNDQLQIVNHESKESQLKLQNALARISTLQDEIKQSQQILLKTKTNLSNSIQNLMDQISSEKVQNENLREEHQKLSESLSEANRELEHEKKLKEKIEINQQNLRQRIDQLETLNSEYENERSKLNSQINELNEKLIEKNQSNEETEEKLRKTMNENLTLKRQIENFEKDIQKPKNSIDPKEYEELKEKYENSLLSNSSLEKLTKSLQSQLKDFELIQSRFESEKKTDQQIITELQNSLNKETDSMKTLIQERKEIQEENQKLKIKFSELNEINSKLKTDFSMIKTEKERLDDMIKEKEESLSALTDSNQDLQSSLTFSNEQIRAFKSTANSMSIEFDSIKKEKENLQRELELSKSSIKSLNHKIENYEKQNHALMQKYQAASKEIESLKINLNGLQKSSNEIREKLFHEEQQREKSFITQKNFENQIKKLSSNLKNSEKQLLLNKKQLSMKSNSLVDLQIQNEKLKSLNEHVENENEALQKERERLNGKINEYEKRLKNENDDQNELNSKLKENQEEKVKKIESLNSELNRKLEENETELKNTKSQLFELKEIVNSLQNKLNEKQEKNSSLETQLFELQRELSDKETTEKSHLAQNEEFCQLFNEIKEENKLLRDQVSVLEDRNKADKLQLENSYLNSIEKLKEKHKNELDTMKNSDSLQKEKIKNLEKQLNDRKSGILKLETQLTTFSQELKCKKCQLKDANKQKKELLDENTNLKASLISKTNQLKKFDHSFQKFNEEKSELLAKINELTTENDELSEIQKKYFNAAAQLNHSESEIRQLKSQVDVLTRLNESLSIEVAETQKTRELASQEFTKMNETVQNIHSFLADDSSKFGLNDMNSNFVNGNFLNELNETVGDFDDLKIKKSELISQIDTLKKNIFDLRNSSFSNSRSFESNSYLND